MTWAIIATWRMALEGITQAGHMLQKGNSAADAMETAICAVEDFEYYKSVGYGGLPNENMEVELDAAFMNGDDLSIGCVGAVQDIANPVKLARHLSTLPFNNFLVAQGAQSYASKQGFEKKNMLTDRAKIHYHNRKKQLEQALKPYAGHDTVGMVDLDIHGSMCAATSTSGLFMKKAGRLGDSPVAGSGFYCDSQAGGACATGLGEDLMKGCISYEIVRLMKEGLTPQQACDKAVQDLDATLKARRNSAGDLSVVALDKEGNWGAASNIDGFSFAVMTQDMQPSVFVFEKGKYAPATKKWLDEYMASRTAPLKPL